jgi:DNA-binding MarR family transcriptional regulator
MTEEITKAALKAIRRVMRATDRGGRKLAAATGLTPSQLLVLQEIYRSRQTTPSAVAKHLQFGQATVTNIVDRLEEAGLVTRSRDETDKRQMVLRVAAAGETILEKTPDSLQARFQDRFQALPAWEQAMILAAVERLGELLDASDIDAAPLLDVGVIDRPFEDKP